MPTLSISSESPKIRAFRVFRHVNGDKRTAAVSGADLGSVHHPQGNGVRSHAVLLLRVAFFDPTSTALTLHAGALKFAGRSRSRIGKSSCQSPPLPLKIRHRNWRAAWRMRSRRAAEMRASPSQACLLRPGGWRSSRGRCTRARAMRGRRLGDRAKIAPAK
jgi:hypothetical protein